MCAGPWIVTANGLLLRVRRWKTGREEHAAALSARKLALANARRAPLKVVVVKKCLRLLFRFGHVRADVPRNQQARPKRAETTGKHAAAATIKNELLYVLAQRGANNGAANGLKYRTGINASE